MSCRSSSRKAVINALNSHGILRLDNNDFSDNYSEEIESEVKKNTYTIRRIRSFLSETWDC